MDNTSPPFERGKGFQELGSAIASANYGGVNLEGTRYTGIEQGTVDAASGLRSVRRAGDAEFIAVRNTAAISLLPGFLCRWASGNKGKRVDGYYLSTLEPPAGIVDEFLPSAGVNAGNMFWLQVKGLCLCRMPETEIADVANDTMMAGLTFATSNTITGSGRVVAQAIGGATTVQSNQLVHRIGVAQSAVLSAVTTGYILVDVDIVV